MSVMFIHGYQSSNKTNKFTVINEEKVCETVDYDELTFAEVEEFYLNMIQEHQPDILVGHSLGGFWCLHLSKYTGLPCIIINPQLNVSRFAELDYPVYENWNEYFDGDSWVYSYIETGDEILDVPRTIKTLKANSECTVFEGGHHRVENINYINTMIETFKLDKWHHV